MRVSDLADELDMTAIDLLVFLFNARIPTHGGDNPFGAKIDDWLVPDVRDRVTQSRAKTVLDHVHEKNGDLDEADQDEQDEDDPFPFSP